MGTEKEQMKQSCTKFLVVKEKMESVESQENEDDEEIKKGGDVEKEIM